MLDWIWLAVAIGGWNNRLGEVTGGAFDGAKTAVTIALGLMGRSPSSHAPSVGSVTIKQTRHAIPAGLLGDLAGVIASVIVCRAVF